MAALPDELWRRILEIGVQSGGFSYRDLCCLSISCRRLRRLSDEDFLWSPLIASDFPPSSSSSSSSITANTPHSSSTSKSLYKFRFEKDRDKRIAAHRRVVLRKESQVLECCRKIREMEAQLVDETRKMRATVAELSSLSKVRQASIALNVWQPEVIRGRQKQMVEQSVVPVESRFCALEMELKLCQQQILGLEKAHRDEKRRITLLEEELQSIKYHPLRVQEPTKCTDVGFKTKSKKLKRCASAKWVIALFLPADDE